MSDLLHKVLDGLHEEAKKKGLTFARMYLEDRKKSFAKYPKLIPNLWNAVMNKRYILPNYRQVDYYSQELCDYFILEFLIRHALGTFKTDGRDEVLNTQWIAAATQLDYDRPTYFLEKELGKPLFETRLPNDFLLEDIHWRFPSFRVYLPKGLLSINRKGVDSNMMYLDIMRVDIGEFNLAEKFEKELYKKLGCTHFAVLKNTFLGMGVSGNLDLDSPESAIGYAATSPLQEVSIKKVFEIVKDSPLVSPIKSDEIDHVFTNKMLVLAINLLMFMGAYPLEYDVKDIIRAPKQEGKRQITGLYKAKFIGASQLRPKHKETVSTSGTGIEVSPHWVKGHWKRVCYGTKNSLRRLQWIGLYHTGEIA